MGNKNKSLCEALSDLRYAVLRLKDAVVEALRITILLDKISDQLNSHNKKSNPLCGECEERYDYGMRVRRSHLAVGPIPMCKLLGELSWDDNEKVERHDECQKDSHE